jgi:SAM-dependent methyltransferase
MESQRLEDGFAADPYLELETGYYDRVFQRGRGMQWFWHEARFRRVEEALPPVYESLLDLGCGAGTFLGRVAPSSVRALGLDLAPGQIEYARERFQRPGLEFEVADLRALDARARFDAIVAIEVLEHLPRSGTATFLRRAFEHLEPGGTLVLTTPNYRSLWPVLERLVSWIGPVDYTTQHINPFDPARLEDEIRAVGFEEVEVFTFFVSAPFLATVSTRLADAVLRLEDRWLRRAGAELIARATRPPA